MAIELSYFLFILLILGILLLLWWIWKIVTATATVVGAFTVSSGPAGTVTEYDVTVSVGGSPAPDNTPVTVGVVDADGTTQPDLTGVTSGGVAKLPFTVPAGAAVGIWEFTPSALGTTGDATAFTLIQQSKYSKNSDYSCLTQMKMH